MSHQRNAVTRLLLVYCVYRINPAIFLRVVGSKNKKISEIPGQSSSESVNLIWFGELIYLQALIVALIQYLPAPTPHVKRVSEGTAASMCPNTVRTCTANVVSPFRSLYTTGICALSRLHRRRGAKFLEKAWHHLASLGWLYPVTLVDAAETIPGPGVSLDMYTPPDHRPIDSSDGT